MAGTPLFISATKQGVRCLGPVAAKHYRQPKAQLWYYSPLRSGRVRAERALSAALKISSQCYDAVVTLTT
jgi:hypothetical protein